MKHKRFIGIIMSAVIMLSSCICAFADENDIMSVNRDELSENNLFTSDNVVSGDTFDETESDDDFSRRFTPASGVVPSKLKLPNDDPVVTQNRMVASYMTNDTKSANFYYDRSNPSYFDTNYITPVRNQLAPGSVHIDSNNCWIFSAIAAMESALLNNTSAYMNTLNLSEEHVRQSLLEEYNNAHDDNCFCVKRPSSALSDWKPYNVPGNFEMVLAYLMRGTDNGVILENINLPFYNSSVGAINGMNLPKLSETPNSINMVADLNLNDYPDEETKMLEKRTRTAIIKNLIQNNKNVVIWYKTNWNTDYKGLNYKNNGYTYTQYHHMGAENPNETYTNHAIELVGWDDNISFTGTSYKGAFIAKNSYGNRISYGGAPADGFVYMSYDDVANYYDVRSIKKFTSHNTLKKRYELDKLGETDIVDAKTLNNTNNITHRAMVVQKFTGAGGN